MKNKTKGVILAVTAALMWGIMGIFVRGLQEFGCNAGTIGFIRCLVAGVSFFLFMLIKNPSTLKISPKGLWICFLYGAIAYSISFSSYSAALERIPVAVATVLMFMSPIWVALLSVVVFHEKIPGKKLIAIAICILGAVLVTDLVSNAEQKLDFLGIIFGVINGFGVALQIMIPRYFSDQYSKDAMLAYGFLGATLAFTPFTQFNVISASLTGVAAGEFLGHILGVGLLGTMVANVAYVKSTHYIDASATSILSALEVVVGCVVGFLLFSETLGLFQILGAAIIIFGAVYSQLGEKAAETIH